MPQFANLHPVHRIDKDTSGLLVLGKSKSSARKLQSLWQDENTEKTYRGIILDRTERDQNSVFRFSQKISKNAGGFKNIRGPKPWVDAITKVQVLESNSFLTKLSFSIETGRTHQIRKHCAINWGPILNDKRYSSKKALQLMEKHYPETPMCLHSYSLKIGDYFWEAVEPDYIKKQIGS
jgi:tRNA pseudouridine65 synthase